MSLSLAHQPIAKLPQLQHYKAFLLQGYLKGLKVCHDETGTMHSPYASLTWPLLYIKWLCENSAQESLLRDKRHGQQYGDSAQHVDLARAYSDYLFEMCVL